MKFVGDFHIHSKYARATSPDMNLENLDEWAKIKGIKVISTGDFTHPAWFKELQEKLEPAEPGLYKLRRPKGSESRPQASGLSGSESGTRFILTTEISCIYSTKGGVRKVHLILFAPSLEAVEKINTQLGWIGNLKSDGRPIIGINAKDVVKICLDASPDCMVVPAHIWTPWFSVFGSKSGFNSLEECFDEYTQYIYAVETGLSSDPAMNWQVSQLDSITLISNSDSHSLAKIGREANFFDTEVSYFGIADALKTKDPAKFLFTAEFFPEEGKYHYDGHRTCGVSMKPEESKKHNNICPQCKKPLTIGVLNRVAELADREEGFQPENAIPFKSMIPLEEIIADSFHVGVASKRVREEYEKLIKALGNEFDILLNIEVDALGDATSLQIAEGIVKVREGKVKIDPGYDGEYGKIKIFEKGEQENLTQQSTLF